MRQPRRHHLPLAAKERVAAGLLALLAACALFRLTATWPDTPDGFFHLQRVRALGEALQWGVLYPRWFPDFAFGYGYPVLHFYAPLFYYLPALFYRLGLDVITATRLGLAVWYGLSAWTGFHFLRRWGNPWAAFAGTVLYLTYPYRLYDLFVRGALPEFAAFAWLPVVAGATWTLVARAREKESIGALARPAAGAALAWAALLLTHNLTAWMAVLVLAAAVGAGVLFRRAMAGAAALIPLGWGAALAAFYVLPVWAEMTWVGIGLTPPGTGYLRHLVPPQHVFTFDLFYAYPTAAEPTVPTPFYVGGLILLALGLALWTRRRLATVAAIGSTALVLLGLTTTLAAPIWHALAPLLARLQFPWRWHTLLALLLALLLTLALDILGQRARRVTAALSVLAALYFVLHAWPRVAPPEKPLTATDITVETMWAFDAEHGQVGATWTAEFLPRWVEEQRWAIGREPSTPEAPPQLPPLEMLVLERLGYLTLAGRYRAATETAITFHIFYYPAWTVRVDGEPVPTWPATKLGLLAARLPAGEHRFEVRWGVTPAVRWGRWISGLAWVALGVALRLAFCRWRAPLLASWAILTLLALGNTTGVFERTVLLRHPSADFGSLSLAAAHVPEPQSRPFRPVLYWLVRTPRDPVIAFVHLYDEAGQLVAQHDGPLGSPYTPAARWVPNFLVPDPHPMALPPDAAGRFTLKAGLYPPGKPQARLRGEGTDAEGFILLGTVEVVP